MIRQTPGLDFDPTLVDVRETIGKVRKTYGVFSQPASHAPMKQKHVATIALDFIAREYYQPDGICFEHYVKYEVEKQRHIPASQFDACVQTLRAFLPLPSNEPTSLLTERNAPDQVETS